MIQIDMEMPKRCCDCRLCDMCGYCKALLKYVLTEDNYNVRAEDCPLKEIPNGENIMIINKDKLHCDCQWDYEDDYYTAYSMYAIEAAQIE